MSAVEAIKRYVEEVRGLADAGTTTETSYYPAIKSLLESVLEHLGLDFQVRTGTAEDRSGGGRDQPDLAIYDSNGEYVVVAGEIKTPQPDLESLAMSTERNDQVGRYLSLTRVVLLFNVRSFGLLTVAPSSAGNERNAPENRVLEQTVEFWATKVGMLRGDALPSDAFQQLSQLIEDALTKLATLGSPESLAKVLARQAKLAKAQLPNEFTTAVSGLADDFREALGVSFEGPEGEEFFRSSLIQTVFYGLFAGWTLWARSGSVAPFRWEDLVSHLRIPFLGELFYELQHPTRIQELGLRPFLSRATETLARVDRESFFERFKTPSLHDFEDDASTAAILYFYEPFLEAFDPELRKELGVWYTPREIVRYQVRYVDKLLRDELGCPLGLADEKVVILDPACGTGAYLIEVLRIIAERLKERGAGALLAEKLLEAVRKRVIGFEILTAPFVIAQLQIYLLLSNLGAPPATGQRPAVFLTNALTGWEGTDQVKLRFPELQEEHDAAKRVKRGGKIIVILGNPPYNRFAGVPLEEEADLADHYKGIVRNDKGKQLGSSRLYTEWGVRKQLLNELYVRFFRLAERCIGERAEFGLVSFITNYSFLGGRSHPLMRESLLKAFDSIWVDCLNGDKYKTGKVIPAGLPGAGTSDQSIFSTAQDARGIQPGTAITTMLKRRGHSRDDFGNVHFRHFWGRAEDKRSALLKSLAVSDWSSAEARTLADTPAGPREYRAFEPSQSNRWKLIPFIAQGGFEDWPALDQLFARSLQGVNPNRGITGSVIEMDQDLLTQRMTAYFSDKSDESFAAEHPVLFTPRARYTPAEVRLRLKQETAFEPNRIVPYVIFPLDDRWVYLETKGKLLNESRPELWENLADNEFLVAVPEPRKYSEIRPLLLSSAFDLHLHDRGSICFPAFITEATGGSSLFESGLRQETRTSNLNNAVWQALKGFWRLSGDLEGNDALTLSRQIARMCMAICHSSAYELEHKDSLAQDWAHVPVPKDKGLFEELVEHGGRIASLLNPLASVDEVLNEVLAGDENHLAAVGRRGGGAVRQADLIIKYSFFGNARGGWRRTDAPNIEENQDSIGDLYINDEIFYSNVPLAVWTYELGGYPVIKKWLAYRDKGRRPGTALSLHESEHLQSMVRRIAALLSMRKTLDNLYEAASLNSFTLEELGLG